MVANSNGSSTPAWCLHQLRLQLLKALIYPADTSRSGISMITECHHYDNADLKNVNMQTDWKLQKQLCPVECRQMALDQKTNASRDTEGKSRKCRGIMKCVKWLCFSWKSWTGSHQAATMAHNKQRGQLTTRWCCCGGTRVMTWPWYGRAIRGIKEGQSKHAADFTAARRRAGGAVRQEEVVKVDWEEGAVEGGETQTTHFQSSVLNTLV